MFIIYLITCLVNGKIYVGKTTKSLGERWASHLAAVSRGKRSRLYAAIHKHGSSSFFVEMIDSTDNLDELDDLERKWIANKNSNNPLYGYNMTEGGDGGDTSSGLKRSPETIARMKVSSAIRKDLPNEEIIRLYEDGLGSGAIAEMLGVGQSCILSRIKEAGVPRRGGNGKIRKPKPNKFVGPRVGINASRYNHEVPTEELVRLYQEGKTTRQLAKMFDVEKTMVIGRLKSSGVTLRLSPREARAAKLTAEGKEYLLHLDNQELINLYLEGNSLDKIARKFECTSGTIRTRLLKEGIALRDRTGKVKENNAADA
jgi:group I intron endonuclease